MIPPYDIYSAFDQLEAGSSIVLEPGGCVRCPSIEPNGEVSLGVWSSGSTGTPKLVWKSWTALKRELRLADLRQGWTWATAFEPWTFAGAQVALQAWACRGRLVILDKDWAANWQKLEDQKVDALSCTPTFIDLMVQSADRAAPASLKQITLGGEVLRAELGSRLAARFPHVRFTVVYASAQLGVLLKTARLDGWYEIASLEKRYPQWRIVSEQLEVFRDSDWEGSGDLVEVRDELMRVVGRADAVANVAGTKVNLGEISALAEQVAGVRRALAVAERNSITGEVVCLKYAVEPGASPMEVQQSLERELRGKLSKEAWPRRWVLDPVEPRINAKR